MDFERGFKEGFADARGVILRAFESAVMWEQRDLSDATSERIDGRVAGLLFASSLARRALGELSDFDYERAETLAETRYLEERDVSRN